MTERGPSTSNCHIFTCRWSRRRSRKQQHQQLQKKKIAFCMCDTWSSADLQRGPSVLLFKLPPCFFESTNVLPPPVSSYYLYYYRKYAVIEIIFCFKIIYIYLVGKSMFSLYVWCIYWSFMAECFCHTIDRTTICFDLPMNGIVECSRHACLLLVLYCCVLPMGMLSIVWICV